MDDDILKALENELKAADEREKQTRKLMMSRRGFVRTFVMSALTASAVLSTQNADACSTNTIPCPTNAGGTTCVTNTGCTGGAVNTCTPNVCTQVNTCGPGSTNTCGPNLCYATNSCQSNTCNPQNTCVATSSNNCGPQVGGNVCAPVASGNTSCASGNG